MAHLYKHKVHGWQVKYWINFPDGTRKPKFKVALKQQAALLILKDAKAIEDVSLSGTTNEEAAYFVNIGLISDEEAQKITGNKAYMGTSWDVLEELYMQHLNTVGNRGTNTSYRYIARGVIRWFSNEDISPSTIKETDIEEFITNRRSHGKTQATCNKDLTVLRIMLDYAVSSGAIKENPARKVKTFKGGIEKAPRIIYPGEFEAFMAQLRAKKELLFGYFMEMMLCYLYTGLRRTELLKLKNADINIQHGYFRIEDTKNNKERIVEIHPELMSVIKTVIEKNGANKGRYFFGGKDKPLCIGSSITHAFSKLDVPEGLTLHGLRHTFITYMLQSGNNLKTVQKTAGHKRLSTTFRYTHFIPSKETVSKIDYGFDKV